MKSIIFLHNHFIHSIKWTCRNFRHVETLFIQGNVFIRPGPLLVGAIPPTNSGSGRIKTLPWMNKFLHVERPCTKVPVCPVICKQ